MNRTALIVAGTLLWPGYVSAEPEAIALLAPDAVTVAPGYEQAFQAGEDLRFRIRWGKITGGYSSLTVVQESDTYGQPAFHLVSEARSSGFVDTIYKVKDRNETWIRKNALGTLRYEKNISEGRYKVNEIVVLDHAQKKFFRNKKRKGQEDKLSSGDIPPGVFDVFGSLYYVRTLPLEVGKSFSIDVQDGGKVWPLVVNVLKRETVKVKAGAFDCYKVEPVLREPGMFVAKGKKLEVWMTADERRMPVLMRSEVFIGHVSAELVEAKLPPKEQPSLVVSAKQKFSSLLGFTPEPVSPLKLAQ